MNEALLLLLDLAVMFYACWVVIRLGRKNGPPEAGDLGLLGYKDDFTKDPS